MAKAIASNAISEKWLKFDPDWIGEDQALPDSTDATSDVFEAGYDANGVAIVVQADTTINLDTTGTLKYELLYDTSETGDFADSVILLDQTGGDVIEIGDDVFPEYSPGEIGPFCKLKRTTTTDLSAAQVNEYLRYVTR